MNEIIPLEKQFLKILDKEIPSYLNAEEVHEILDSIPEKKKRDHLLIHLLWGTGLRISEALNLTQGNFDLFNRRVRVVTLKRKKRDKKMKPYERVIPLPLALASEIGAYFSEMKPEGKIFPISRQQAFLIVKKYTKLSGIRKPVHPHTFRHSYAVNCLTQGLPLSTLKEYLGHALIQNTMVYLKIVRSDQERIFDQIQF